MPTRTPTTSTSAKEEAAKKRTATPLATQKTLTPTSALSTIELQQMAADPRTARPSEVLAIQRRFGNQAVTRLIQAKLTVGAAHDAYEQEADRVATQVMSVPEHVSTVQRFAEDEEEIQAKPLAATITPLVQRAAEDEEELQAKFIQRDTAPEEDELQTKSVAEGGAFSPGADFEGHLNAVRGGGTPLPDSVREFMEPRFGADFSGVRLHTGAESAKLNRAVSAQAFTQGQDIYLGEGHEDIVSSGGQHLLAHELTHVVQQHGGGPGRDTPVQRYTASEDGNYNISEHNQFAIAKEPYPQAIFTQEGRPLDLPGGLTWRPVGIVEIDHRPYTKYEADTSRYDRENGPGSQKFCGQFARGLTGREQTEEQSTSEPGGVLYDADTSPGRETGWENHYASVVMRDGGDHATFETAVGIDHVWAGIYGTERGKTFKYKTQEANIERLMSLPDIVFPERFRMKKSLLDYLLGRPGEKVVIDRETRVPQGISQEEGLQWKREMEAWRDHGTAPESAYMKKVIPRLEAELEELEGA